MATGSASDVDFEKIDFDSLINMKNYMSKGAFGAVYGPFTWNSKKFAVKHILLGQEGLEFIKRVEGRKTIWTSLKHEHLIEIHYASLKPKTVYIVMEYAGGGSLRQQLLDNSTVKVLRQIYILSWARQIAEGMLYLHDKGIVHRDLKSSNIVLMEPYDSLNARVETTLKITDFDSVQEHVGTTTMSLCGTYTHMAPEVLMQQRFSKGSDVWSYGVLLWEMLTRELPHDGQTVGPLVAKAISGQLALSIPESIHKRFKDVLCDCWCNDTKSRLPFKDIIDQLDSICERKIEVRYNSDPVSVQIIRTKAAEEEEKAIYGLTILDKELFIVTRMTSEVEVYDTINLSLSGQWILKDLMYPKDIGSCNRNKCLYVFDFKGSGQSKVIMRVHTDGKLINKWSIGDDDGYYWGGGLSVTKEANVILTVFSKNKLQEYSPDGRLIRQISMSTDADIRNLWYATKLTNRHFVVSHGYGDDELHRVCVVDADGTLKKSFGGKCGSTIGQTDIPVYLAIDGNGFVVVADLENNRVLILDSDLKFKREVRLKEEPRLRHPLRVLLDESNGRIFVADNGWDSRKQIYSDGRILILSLNE